MIYTYDFYKQTLISILRSKKAKRITFILGLVLLLVSSVSFYDPKPFLRLGYFGIFVFSFLGSGSLLVASLAGKMDLLTLSLVATLGMALNDTISWFIGRSGEEVIPPSTKLKKIERIVHKYGFYGLFFFAVIPFPYDFIGLIAGYLGFSFSKFFIPTFLGKFIKVILLGFGAVKILGS